MTRNRSLVVIVVVAALLAVGIVGWWQFAASAVDNEALVDDPATAEVQSQVAQGLEKVLTYDYQDPQTTKTAADDVLTGKARTEYDTLFADLEKQAPGQKLVLTAKVATAGVERLDDRTAQLLVFIDQSSRRAGQEQASVSAAQISVKARKTSGGKWTITHLNPL